MNSLVAAAGPVPANISRRAEHFFRRGACVAAMDDRSLMPGDEKQRAKRAIGPDGRILTLANLPRPPVARWVARRKAEIVASVHGGLLDRNEACERYLITNEEFLEWDRAYAAFGLAGLKIRSKRQKEHQP
jgi:hypothetical protein